MMGLVTHRQAAILHSALADVLLELHLQHLDREASKEAILMVLYRFGNHWGWELSGGVVGVDPTDVIIGA